MRANKRSKRLSGPFKTRLSLTRNAPMDDENNDENNDDDIDDSDDDDTIS